MVNHVTLVGNLMFRDKDQIVLDVDGDLIDIKFDKGYLESGKEKYGEDMFNKNNVIGIRGKLTGKGVHAHALSYINSPREDK